MSNESLESKSRVEVEEKAMGAAHSAVGLGLKTSTKMGGAHSAVQLQLKTSTKTGLGLKT